MDSAVTLNDIVNLAKQLSPVDKVRLIEQIASDVEQALAVAEPIPLSTLRGIWKDIEITDEDIDEARREMWANFPRDDL